MPNLPNLSGSNIQDTYQRVLHTDGTLIYNGTGSVMSILPVTASYAISASHEITYELSSSYAETASMASSNFNVQGNISASGTISAGVGANKIHGALQLGGAIQNISDGEDYIAFSANNVVEIGDPSGAVNSTVLKVDDVNSKVVITSGTPDAFTINALNGNVTASGNISASGTITGNSIVGTIGTATQGTVDHDSLANFVAAEHYRWDTDISSTATINAANIPTLNQNTTGTAAGLSSTLAVGSGGTGTTSLTDKAILLGNGTGAVESSVHLNYANLTQVDTDEDRLVIGDSNSTKVAIYGQGGVPLEIFVPFPPGNVSNTVGGDLNLKAGQSSGNVVGGSIKFFSSPAGSSGASVNGSTEIAAFDNVGNLQIDGGLSASGNITAGNVFLPSNGKISFDNSLNGSDQFISGVDNQIVIDGDDLIVFKADTDGYEFRDTSNVATVHITTAGAIAATGNISASGDLYSGDKLYINSKEALEDTGTTLSINEQADFTDGVQINRSNLPQPITLFGSVTASSNISSSGQIYAENVYADDILYLSGIPAVAISGTQLQIGNANDWTSITYGRNTGDAHSFTGAITASGIISASAGIITPTLSGGAIGDPSGSLTLSGSLSFNDNIPTPEISASTLFVKTSIEANHDLRYSNIGLTPAFGYASLDDAGTNTSDEILFGVGSAVTSVQHNMQVIHDTTTNGTRIYALYDGVYKVTGNYLFEGSTALTTIDIKVDGTAVHTQIPRVHGSVDPVNRTHIYVGSIDSGSYVTATADGTSLEYEIGSVLMVERLI